MRLFSLNLYHYTIIFLGILVAIILVSNSLILWQARSLIVSNPQDLREAQTAIVLGAAVYNDGSLSPVFKERVDRAAALYKQGIVKKILVSGDNGSRNYNEVSPVHLYLIEKGVPAEDIFLDYAGFDTYDTMYRAKAVFKVESAVVVTQSFHLPRAVFLARHFGIKVEGIPPVVDLDSWHNTSREALARVKAIWDVILHTQPEYLGEAIPITGDGRNSVGEDGR